MKISGYIYVMKIMLVQWFNVATLTATFQKSDLTNHMLPLVWLHGMVKPIASNFVSENVICYVCCISRNYCNVVECSHHFSTYYHYAYPYLQDSCGSKTEKSWAVNRHAVQWGFPTIFLLIWNDGEFGIWRCSHKKCNFLILILFGNI